MKYDYVIIGAGMFGAVFAREVKAQGKNVLLMDKRNHISGNCFTYDDQQTGINVHKYGTHIFHTNSKSIWDYVNQFTEFNRYQHRVLTTHKDKVYPLPINLQTINDFFNLNLKPHEAEDFLKTKAEPIQDPGSLEEMAVANIGRELYEAFFKGYTMKQWNLDPKQLPADIITRLPIRYSYYDSYFNDIYQGLPIGGYTKFFESLLQDIPVELNVDFFDDRDYWKSKGKVLVYSGPLDRYFDYSFGHLRWRSVRFEKEHVPMADYQGTSVMNFSDVDVPHIRVHEPKHLHREKDHQHAQTVILREYSCTDSNEPYYPVRLHSDKVIANQYKGLQQKEEDVIFGGRLAEYKYYDMHQAIHSALQKSHAALQGKLL